MAKLACDFRQVYGHPIYYSIGLSSTKLWVSYSFVTLTHTDIDLAWKKRKNNFLII